jgi:hypothetical protein
MSFLKNMKNRYLITVGLVLCFYTSCVNKPNLNNSFQSDKLSVSKLLSSEIPEGKIEDMIYYSDQFGNHILISVNNTYSKREKYNDEYADMAFASFQLIDYLIEDTIIKKNWMITDSVNGGLGDADAEIINNSISVIDLNQNGKTDVWFAYKIGSRSDMSPINMKVVMIEDNKISSLKGSTMLYYGNGIYSGGNFDIENKFENKQFESYAIKLWNENVLEQRNEETMPSRIDDKLIWNSAFPGKNGIYKSGQLIQKTNGQELQTTIARKYSYNNNTKLAVVFFTFTYTNGVKDNYHGASSSIRIAYFNYNKQNGWKFSEAKDFDNMPQEGYGLEPPIEFKYFNNKPCLYVKYEQGGYYEYYFDIEALKQVN